MALISARDAGSVLSVPAAHSGPSHTDSLPSVVVCSASESPHSVLHHHSLKLMDIYFMSMSVSL